MEPAIHPTENVELNTASEEALADEVGLGPERARRIVAARPLRSWDDIARLEGFTAQIANQLRASGAQLGDPARADLRPETEAQREERTLDNEGVLHSPR